MIEDDTIEEDREGMSSNGEAQEGMNTDGEGREGINQDAIKRAAREAF